MSQVRCTWGMPWPWRARTPSTPPRWTSRNPSALRRRSHRHALRTCTLFFPYRTPSSFFWLRFFFGVHFCEQTPGTYLHHTVLLVGVTDPGNSGAWLGWGSYFIWIYMGISTFSNAHNFVKNLVWTSFYSPFWSSWADLSFAPTFRVWRQILFFQLVESVKATVHRIIIGLLFLGLGLRSE